MIKKLNDAIEYIENHLTDELSLKEISGYVGVSDFHFRKIFFYLANMTLSEYVRNRRLSEAGKELLSGEKVTDVAYKYGYRSIDGFARAFNNWSGILPSDVFKKKQRKEFPKISFVVTVKGANNMDYKIVEMPSFNFAGVSNRVPMQFQGINDEIVKLAQSITDEQREELHRLQNIEPHEIMNVSYDSDTDFLEEEGELTHMIGVLTTEDEIGAQLEIKSVKPYTWAVFPSEGSFPDTYQDTMARIYSEWFLTSDYELADSLSFSFTKMDPEKNNYAYSEIWIPVIIK